MLSRDNSSNARVSMSLAQVKYLYPVRTHTISTSQVLVCAYLHHQLRIPVFKLANKSVEVTKNGQLVSSLAKRRESQPNL